MDEDPEDPSSPSPSCSTDPQPTVSPDPDRNHGDQEYSNHGDQKDTPQGQERVTVSLDINSETPTFNIVVKEEEEDWELDNAGESPSHQSAGGERPSTSGEPESDSVSLTISVLSHPHRRESQPSERVPAISQQAGETLYIRRT
ncbi:clumping factor B-like [Oncorhynchus masou masou]|uniref:clumping factor B-like n=1 Tax=Oncorhynchus masou masou TaxID=90313 RepID=UPI00318448E7